MPSPPPNNNPADRLKKDLEAFDRAMAELFAAIRGVSLESVRAAIRSGSVLPITGSRSYVRGLELGVSLTTEVQDTLIQAGLQSGLREVGRSQIWSRVAEIAEEYGAPRATSLIKAIDGQTRLSIRRLIRTASAQYAREPSLQVLRDLAEDIRGMIGLTPKQAALIRKRRAVKLAKGLHPSAVREDAKRQISNAIRLRGKMIADRGVVESISFSRHQAWVEAREVGDLPSDVMKWWQDQSDAAVRPTHSEQTRIGPIPLDEEFELHGVLYPPSPAPGCRCWHVLWDPSQASSLRF